MDVALFIGLIALGTALIIIGLLGSILPVLPGPPVSYLSLLVMHFSGIHHFETWILVSVAAIMILILALDYIIPIYGTKKLGGSKYGIWGSGIGLIFGIFLAGPTVGLSILFGPFIGAVVGELISGKQSNEAIKAGTGAFLGFLAGTFFKIIICLVIAGIFIYGSIQGAVQVF